MATPQSPAYRDLLWRAGGALAASLLIAALLAVIGGMRFEYSLVYSCCIGMLCWLAVDGGRSLASTLQLRLGRDSEDLRRGWPGWPAMAVVIPLGTVAAYIAGTLAADRLTGVESLTFGHGALRAMLLLMLISAAVGTAITSFFYARGKLAQARAQTEGAQRLAAENQLKLLQSQLEPHMLFNTLANLRVLIGSDPPRAQAMLDHLIAFLRSTLGASRSSSHPLAAEFERTADYLALMAVRMGPRLRSELDLPSDLRGVAVPPLLLQPLVENSIRHGLEPQRRGGCITVRARREGGQLVLEVQDDGAGLDAAAGSEARAGTAGGGFGLDQVRQRLATLYGGRARLDLSAVPAGGTLARITMPIGGDA